MPTYSIDVPKQLAREEFEALRGTNLYEAMFRNRVRVRVEGSPSDKESALKNIIEWLKDRVQSHYYVETSVADGGFLYFEDQAEMVAFTLTFNAEEVAISSPAAPADDTGGAMPVSISKKKLLKPWEIPDVLPEQVWKSANLNQTRARYGEEMVQRAWKVLRRK